MGSYFFPKMEMIIIMNLVYITHIHSLEGYIYIRYIRMALQINLIDVL